MPSSLAQILASRDWYPSITMDGAVTDVVRFVDLDAQPLKDLSALQSRVCLVIGTTAHPDSESISRTADHLDLVMSSEPVHDSRVIAVADLEQAISMITSTARQSPRATLVLSSLLRQTSALPIAQAIAAEAAAYSTLLAGPEFAAWLSTRGARKPSPATESARVDSTLADGVLSIRMMRKLRLNAIDSAMRAALVEAFTIAIADAQLQVRLSGEGPCFSNGGDLREFGTTPDAATAWAVRMTQHPGWLLGQIADRTRVHMHGPCVGAGVEIAAFASRVTADPATTFLLPELHMGLLPGAGGCVSIPRRIGRWRTLWMLLTASTLSAQQALEWGLIDDITGIE